MRILGTNSLRLALERLARLEPLVTCLRSADLVVINGEGVIHHHGMTAWTLLCIGSLAKRSGKKVLLANSTIQSMGFYTARGMLSDVDHVWVRDWFSHLYLERLGVNHTVAADCAAVAEYDEISESSVGREPRGILLSAGVGVRRDFVEKLVDMLRLDGRDLAYLNVDKADAGHREMLRRRGVHIVDGAHLDWRRMPAFLQRYSLVISGRHHLNTFAILSGVPFVPIGSNSWKIQGTLALCELGTDLLSSRNLVSLPSRMEDALHSSAQLPVARDRLQELAERHFDGMI